MIYRDLICDSISFLLLQHLRMGNFLLTLEWKSTIARLDMLQEMHASVLDYRYLLRINFSCSVKLISLQYHKYVWNFSKLSRTSIQIYSCSSSYRHIYLTLMALEIVSNIQIWDRKRIYSMKFTITIIINSQLTQ